ncbi:hypothetical protein Tco_0365846 [Tanacetum coccineum]
MMRESEVYKFSDGTLIRILEKLDHMVKDFVLFKFNRGMEYRIWSEDDKRRSKEFIDVIERRLKIRRIFRILESFVSRRNWVNTSAVRITMMIADIEESRHGPSDAMHNPP